MIVQDGMQLDWIEAAVIEPNSSEEAGAPKRILRHGISICNYTIDFESFVKFDPQSLNCAVPKELSEKFGEAGFLIGFIKTEKSSEPKVFVVPASNEEPMDKRLKAYKKLDDLNPFKKS